MTSPSSSRQAMTIWVVGVAVYFVAVLQRSSLAVAGLLAAERFEISASQLSTFVVLQLLVYALMQVPVGLLVDRFTPLRQIGVTQQTFYRWRKLYGGMQRSQLARLKELEKENQRLRRAVSDLTLDKLILTEAAKGNF